MNMYPPPSIIDLPAPLVRADSEPKLTLKFQIETRWSCRYESVNAVVQQLESTTKALLELKDYKDSKTPSNTKS